MSRLKTGIRVWVLLYWDDNEADDGMVVGVYETQELADSAAKAMEARLRRDQEWGDEAEFSATNSFLLNHAPEMSGIYPGWDKYSEDSG